MKEPKQRTLTQNRSLHKGFSLVADQLNEKGLTVEYMMSLGVELSWTDKLVKDWYRMIGEKLYGKDSTADLTTKELQGAWEHMSATLGKAGVFTLFPSVDGQMLNSLTNED